MTKRILMKTRGRIKIIVECVSILYWLLFLHNVDSYYVPYLVVGLAGVCLGLRRHILKKEVLLSKKEYQVTEFFAIAMSCMVLLANYQYFIWSESGFKLYPLSRTHFKVSTDMGTVYFDNLNKIVAALLIFVGGIINFKEVMLGLTNFSWGGKSKRLNEGPKDKFIWIGMWAVIVAVNSSILFMAVYPGTLTPDSISQMTQLLEGSYSNHHPYYHTQIIHFCINIGMWLFDDINAAVALYSCFSIAMMALCFTYVVETVDKATGNRKISFILFIWYLIMPFHITYSITMWKDVFWGGAVTGLAVSAYRYLHEVGRQKINILVMTLMAVGTCLLRSNGWTAFFLTGLVFVIIFKTKYKTLIGVFAVVLVGTFVMKHPVLEALDVSQPDTIEALSVPAQQIARVVVNGHELSEEQRELLSQVIDIERIPEAYVSYISDDIKNLVREKGNQGYIKAHKIEFIKLYFELGLEHPKSYVYAWVDETRGYWNAGYNYWKWSTGLQENELGIQRTVNSEAVANKFSLYLNLWETNPILQLFISIGFYTWIILLCVYYSIIKKNKASLFIGVPFLAVIATLLIATPVYAEFRYAYALFCGTPFVLIMSLSDRKKTNDNKTESIGSINQEARLSSGIVSI